MTSGGKSAAYDQLDLGQPKTIVVDPRFGFGQPVLNGTGVTTVTLASRYRAGESTRALAKDYGVDVSNVEDAIRCELPTAA
jgi:uncharacterized protein (DUF433 family)